MKEIFKYPIDRKTLLRKKKSLKKELKENIYLLKKRIAILGGSTTNEIVEQLELFLLNYGIEGEFYQSEYGQFWQDAMFGNYELDNFNPDIIFIHTNWRNILQFPTMYNSREEINANLEREYQRLEECWKALERKFKCPIIQNNFDKPNYRLLGNRDIWDCHGRSNFLFRLNYKLYEYAEMHENFYINDIDYISSEVGLDNWQDGLFWNMYKYITSRNAIPMIAKSVADIIKSIYGKNKKVLVLDLDNTLWGGIVGDDGVEGIAIGPEVPYGQVYAEFQKYCKDLKQIGVVLAVNSKNEEENALAGLQHPDGILRPEDFVAIKANWEPKDQNIHAIADELTLGEDSFVFVDDNPAERAIVEDQIPNIAVPELDVVENYIKILDRSGYFEVTSISGEDLRKTELYHAKTQALKEKNSYADYGEYLDSLNMVAVIKGFEPICVQRVAQLTNKSNQFNLTTLRCTEEDIKKMEADSNYICLCGKLIDKFSDNGIVAISVGEQKKRELHIRLWLMSCRVLKRGMEDAMMQSLVIQAQNKNIETIYGYYYPTAKNSMVKDFYADMGFEKISEDDIGNTVWKLNLNDYQGKKLHMVIEREQ